MKPALDTPVDIGTDVDDEIIFSNNRLLLPLFYAQSVPLPDELTNRATRFDAAQALDHIARKLVTGVRNMTRQADATQSRLDHGIDYSSDEQTFYFLVELCEAEETLEKLRPWYLSMLYGAPREWYEERRDELESMLDAQRDHEYGYLFADVDAQMLLDALVEVEGRHKTQ